MAYPNIAVVLQHRLAPDFDISTEPTIQKIHNKAARALANKLARFCYATPRDKTPLGEIKRLNRPAACFSTSCSAPLVDSDGSR